MSIFSTYDPKLSVNENAKQIGCSEASLRQWMKLQGIQRRYSNSLRRFRQIHALAKKGVSITDIAKTIGCCRNTVNKYLSLKASDIKPKPLNNSSIITSVSYNQQEILNNIIKLYVKQNFFEADFTFSKGIFYSRGVVPLPRFKYDLHPQLEDVLPLNEAENIVDGTLHSVVVDLPFIITGEKWANGSRINNRFDSFPNEKEAKKANTYMLSLAHRKLRKRGILVMKTMDVCTSQSQQSWMSDYVIKEAERLGFLLTDKFIFIAKSRMVVGYRQKMARKLHSYFFVFKK